MPCSGAYPSRTWCAPAFSAVSSSKLQCTITSLSSSRESPHVPFYIFGRPNFFASAQTLGGTSSVPVGLARVPARRTPSTGYLGSGPLTPRPLYGQRQRNVMLTIDLHVEAIHARACEDQPIEIENMRNADTVLRGPSPRQLDLSVQ